MGFAFLWILALVNMRKLLVSALFSGLVSGKVAILTHSFIALSLCLSLTVRISASASAIAVATVQKVPVIACAPTLYTLFIIAAVWMPHACFQTLEA